MLAARPVGRNAAALKYDLLTALGAHALSQGKGPQRMVLRLITLITARYNWTRDELAVGQREIARLWGVDERTVKREMAKLRALGWLRIKRQGARGRVAEYSLDIGCILKATRPQWAAVGPDFDARMRGGDETPENVVALPIASGAGGRVPAPDISDGSEWSLAKALLHAEDTGLYASWFAGLALAGRAGGRLVLRAPSRFHASYVATHLTPRLLAACESVDASISEIVIEA